MIQTVQAAQSALDPSGPQAGLINGLGHFFYVAATVAYVLVVGVLLWAGLHRRAPAPDEFGLPGAAGRRERSLRTAVTAATGVTAAVLFAVLIADYRAGAAYASAPSGAVQIRITGMQWWWDVQYRDAEPQKWVTTANELHVPVGRPVVLELRSSDVIHSFWVPSLVGKRDLIPGRETSIWFRADRPGVYRGQCAEFCGYAHANMALTVIAEPAETFDSWLARQRDTAATPTEALAARGRQVFLGTACVLCHSIQGTPAGSRVGPDLTHLASRLTLAAGSLPNTRGNLAGWIADPQTIKPGARMPPNPLRPADLQALVAYLETLR